MHVDLLMDWQEEISCSACKAIDASLQTGCGQAPLFMSRTDQKDLGMLATHLAARPPVVFNA